MAEKAVQILDEIKAEMHTLDSKITLIAQKIKMIEKNEEVIGRTIVMHNDKIKKIEERGATGNPNSAMPSESLEQLKRDLDELKKKVEALPSREEVQELKYILDTINPLEYATITQVKELLKEKEEKKQ